MSWPAPSDYQEAIQAPRLCFGDPELQQCTPQLDVLGLPRAISGNFAVVFPVAAAGKTWAVRCFTTYHPDQEARYQAISACLQRIRLPWMVDFQFQAAGIRVRGQWYPILKMEWVQGDPLNVYVERNLGDPTALRGLARQFLTLVADLRSHSIAHGDLQHGNILVANGRLRLIDYDGMYTPGLDGLISHELGHRNYQHPGRTARDFGPYVDHFSSWVIYLSLLALAHDPGLWQRAGAGDEYLLLRREDYESPQTSATLAALRQVRDGASGSIAARVESLLERAPDQIPAPERTRKPRTPAQKKPAGAFDWLTQGASRVAAAVLPSAPARRPAPAPVPDWVLEQLGPATPPRSLGLSCWPERLVLAAWTAAMVGLAYLALYGHLSALAALPIAGVTLTGLLYGALFRYLSMPDVAARRQLAAELRALEAGTHRLEKQLARLAGERGRHERAEAAERSRALARIGARYQSEHVGRTRLASATIPGIGPELKNRLAMAGIRTAADVDHSRLMTIPGIGEGRAAALIAWRDACEARAATGMPRRLPAADEAALKRKYEARSASLAGDEAGLRAELAERVLPTARLERELQAYAHVTFLDYLKRIAGLG